MKPGEEKPFSIRVGTCFDLPPHARVQATAVVERGDDESAASYPVAFTLVEGIEFTSDVRTLPGDDRRLFRFELIYWARDQAESIFLRVTDPSRDGRVAVRERALVRRRVDAQRQSREDQGGTCRNELSG